MNLRQRDPDTTLSHHHQSVIRRKCSYINVDLGGFEFKKKAKSKTKFNLLLRKMRAISFTSASQVLFGHLSGVMVRSMD